MTAPTTPHGSRVIVATVPSGEGATWPYSLSAASACQRMQAAVSGMSSPTVSVMGLPASMVSIRPSSRALRLDQVRPVDEDPLPGARVQARPATIIGRLARDGDRDVDIGRAALGDLGDRLAGGRVLGDEAAAVRGIAERAVDEHPGPKVEAVDVGPRLFDGRDERLGHGSLQTTTRRGRGIRSAIVDRSAMTDRVGQGSRSRCAQGRNDGLTARCRSTPRSAGTRP